MKSLAIIIPLRAGDDPYITLHSLGRSTFQDFSITISHDIWGNANKARNAGFAMAPDSEYVLFSDADIEWEPDGIGRLVKTLKNAQSPEYAGCYAYSYGSYEMGGKIYCQQYFDLGALCRANLASTMSVIRRDLFAQYMWDESIDRLQDYDLWLSMARHWQFGIQAGSLIFRTARRDGITQNGKVSYQEAWERLKVKHGL